MSGESLDQFCDRLNPEACRLVNLPERIWLFGGPCSPYLDAQGKCLSLRESFWRQSFAFVTSRAQPWDWIRDLDIPEKHPGWLAFSGYDDLLTFERDACHLAKAIVLFSESEGSLAELGALAVDDSIVNRLIVVIENKYLDENHRNSFINLGPLRRAEALHNRCVISSNPSKDLTQDDFETVMEFVHDKLPTISKSSTEKLRTKILTHRLLLIADIIDMLLISKLDELEKALQHFEIQLTQQDLRRATKLLEFFGLISIEHRGKECFFVQRKKTNCEWVSYTAKADKPAFHRSRFKLERFEIIKNNPRLLSVWERTP